MKTKEQTRIVAIKAPEGALQIPGDRLVDRSWRAWGLQSLFWDYVDTVLDVCVLQHRDDKKKICREIRERQRHYAKFRNENVPSWLAEDEDGRGLLFEEKIKSDLVKQSYVVDLILGKMLLSQNDKDLARAVAMATIMLRVLILYGTETDTEFRKYWKEFPTLGVLFDETVSMIALLPKVAPKISQALRAASVDLCVRILLNRLKTADYFNIPSEYEKLPEYSPVNKYSTDEHH